MRADNAVTTPQQDTEVGNVIEQYGGSFDLATEVVLARTVIRKLHQVMLDDSLGHGYTANQLRLALHYYDQYTK
jgi:hypothetical protein